jgi:glycosyltransferase involved in cell wall biosynthesis
MNFKVLKAFKIVIVHNVSFKEYYGPERAIIDFLRELKIAKLLYIQHPLPPNYKDLSTRAKLYVRGELEKSIKAPSIRTNDLRLIVVYNALATLSLVLLTKEKYDVFIGSDGRNALIGLILRKLGFVKKVVYLSHSYVKSSDSIKNAIIRSLDKHCSLSVDFVWNLSRRLVKIRNKLGVPKQQNIWVPVGVHPEDIDLPKKFPGSNEKKRLVYVGTLVPGKGVELVIKAMPVIMEKIHNVELLIVGGGAMERKLKEECRKTGMEKYVKFLGYMKYQKLMNLLSRCHIGLAPYKPDTDNTASTTDPLKPKLYLAQGLPVIITNFPETAFEIKKSGAGIVINYDECELASAVIRLLTYSNFYEKCSREAIKLASNYLWNKIFERAFDGILRE